ncbi:MAG: DUF1186 domain-containing protein [Pseudomonadota bacterium]
MNPQETQQALAYNTGAFPLDAMGQAIADREAMTPILLAELERASENPQSILDEPDSYIFHLYAMYLLAEFRDQRALLPIVRLCHLPSDTLERLIGDTITEDLGNILASVSGGDISPIKTIIENRTLNEFVRDAGIGALVTLVAEGAMRREALIEYLRELASTLGSTDYLMWALWVAEATQIYPEELMPEIRAAYAADSVDEGFIDLSDIERVLANGQDATLVELPDFYHYITDAVDTMRSWACFRQNSQDYLLELENDLINNSDTWYFFPAPYHRETPKIGRNDPCPCGSGKKYKKCCMPLG